MRQEAEVYCWVLQRRRAKTRQQLRKRLPRADALRSESFVPGLEYLLLRHLVQSERCFARDVLCALRCSAAHVHGFVGGQMLKSARDALTFSSQNASDEMRLCLCVLVSIRSESLRQSLLQARISGCNFRVVSEMIAEY
jgi:hypothetical protein